MVVEQLNIKLYRLFIEELTDLNIGYGFNRLRMRKIMDIINAIEYISNYNLSRKEIIKIINYYE